VANFDLQSYLSAQRAAIDGALDTYLKTQPRQSRSVWQAMRYGVFPGGKRIRPVLTLATGELFGAAQSVLLPFACAIELIHAYSLIHDDLPALDDDDVRRGVPTAHKVFGDGIALLAGDGLLTEAFHILSGPDVTQSLAADLTLRLIHELSEAAGVAGLVGGQALDLEAEDQEVDLALVEYVHVRKTGALILASVRIGAQIGGAEVNDLKRISRFGECLGLAFQIADDILDMQERTSQIGNSESGRKERRKATYPAVVGLPQAKERLRQLNEQCVQELLPFGPAAESLRQVTDYILAGVTQDPSNPTTEEINP
jgi:geranylgeranyl diphosphate synthase type II